MTQKKLQITLLNYNVTVYLKKNTLNYIIPKLSSSNVIKKQIQSRQVTFSKRLQFSSAYEGAKC